MSCDSGSDQKAKATTFETALEAHTGQSFTLVKSSTNQSGYSVFKNEVTGEFVAYNLKKYDATMTMQAYHSAAVPGDIVGGLKKVTEVEHDYDPEFGSSSYSVTYYVYGGLKFENASPASKDLEIMASLQEEAAQTYLSHKFQSEFSLSATRAEELAKLATRYQRLESKRELTRAEKDIFAMEALGVSMSQVEKAMKSKAQGNEAQYEELLHTAASVNRTTPEQIGKFFQEMEGAL